MTDEDNRALTAAKYLAEYCETRKFCDQCIFFDGVESGTDDMVKCKIEHHDDFVPSEWRI